MSHHRFTQRGFTLIELLVVIAIIGILASVVLASLNSARMKARDAARDASMTQAVRALEMYYSQYGAYPPSVSTASSACGGIGYCFDSIVTTYLAPNGYLNTPPMDPIQSGTSNNYRFCSNGTNYTLMRWRESTNNWCQVMSPAPEFTSCYGAGVTGNWTSYPEC